MVLTVHPFRSHWRLIPNVWHDFTSSPERLRDTCAILSQVGGSSRDKKRGKDWLLERILWHLFDFQSGHEIIKGHR
jgi:hypothetical protein